MSCQALNQLSGPTQYRSSSLTITSLAPLEFSVRRWPIDAPAAQCCARLRAPDRRGERDELIAATALVHGMAVVMRNAADFKPTGVNIVTRGSNRHKRLRVQDSSDSGTSAVQS